MLGASVLMLLVFSPQLAKAKEESGKALEDKAAAHAEEIKKLRAQIKGWVPDSWVKARKRGPISK